MYDFILYRLIFCVLNYMMWYNLNYYVIRKDVYKRQDKRSLDFSKMEEQFGDERVVPFSFTTDPESCLLYTSLIRGKDNLLALCLQCVEGVEKLLLSTFLSYDELDIINHEQDVYKRQPLNRL